VLSWLRVIEMPNPQKMKWSKKSEIDASSLPQIPMFGDAE
jgi:hypothetical protein